MNAFSSLLDLAGTAADIAGYAHRVAELLGACDAAGSDCSPTRQERTLSWGNQPHGQQSGGNSASIRTEMVGTAPPHPSPASSRGGIDDGDGVLTDQPLLELKNVDVLAPTTEDSVGHRHRSGDVTSTAPHPVIRELSLCVYPGQSVLVQGISGVGKTSLMRTIAGLWPPRAGSIAFGPALCRGGFDDGGGGGHRHTQDGGAVVPISDRIHGGSVPLPSHCVFVPQTPYVFCGSLLEQIVYPREAPPAESNARARDIARATELLRRLGLSHLIAHTGWTGALDWDSVLSQGEQQRLALVRVLLHPPVLAVLDESTGALDDEAAASAYALLSECGVTMISFCHRDALQDFHSLRLVLHDDSSWTLSQISGE